MCFAICFYSISLGGAQAVYESESINGYLSCINVYLAIFISLSRALYKPWLLFTILHVFTGFSVYSRSLLGVSVVALVLNILHSLILGLIKFYISLSFSRRRLFQSLFFFVIILVACFVSILNWQDIVLSLDSSSKFNFGSFSLFVSSVLDQNRLLIIDSVFDQASLYNSSDLILGPHSWDSSFTGLMFGGNPHNGILRLYIRIGLPGAILVSIVILSSLYRSLRCSFFNNLILSFYCSLFPSLNLIFLLLSLIHL